MYVNVEIILDKAEGVIMVPESSLVYRNDSQVVFVVEENSTPRARMKTVRIGLRKDGVAEINEGLDISDKIIIRGNAFLEEGQAIEIVDG
jgi:multidrug efflux pump subunit AcrA (membrane-fusion protein)